MASLHKINLGFLLVKQSKDLAFKRNYGNERGFQHGPKVQYYLQFGLWANKKGIVYFTFLISCLWSNRIL